MNSAPEAEREIVITRLIAAPRARVFAAFTDPKQVDKWWGPNGFTNSTSEIDVRPGGKWRFMMHGPDGVDYPNEITYLEITPPERLVYTHGGDDQLSDFHTTVTFAEEGGQTRLTMRALFATAAARQQAVEEIGAIEGGNQTLARLAEFLAQSKTVVTHHDRTLIAERVFNAPRDLVFRAYSEPDSLRQWWGPKGWGLPVCEMDFRPGGTWLYCMRSGDGQESWGKAVYHEIVPPERIVYTDYFADAQGNPVPGLPESHVTVQFTAQGGQTKLTVSTLFPSAADLQAVLEMGLEAGLTETWDRLEEYLAQA
jgi:uncharacterized protein YndB with AHSA1/START domain